MAALLVVGKLAQCSAQRLDFLPALDLVLRVIIICTNL